MKIDLLLTVCVNDTKKCRQTPSTPVILSLFWKAFTLYFKINCKKFIWMNVMDNVWLFLFDVASSCLLTTVQLFSEIHKNIDRVSNCRYDKCCIFCCKKRSMQSNSLIADCIATNKLVAFWAERFQFETDVDKSFDCLQRWIWLTYWKQVIASFFSSYLKVRICHYSS